MSWMSPRARSFLTSNAMVVVYAVLIALCVIYAPTRVIRFIYAEF
jgi:hypothetical protein